MAQNTNSMDLAIRPLSLDSCRIQKILLSDLSLTGSICLLNTNSVEKLLELQIDSVI
jgi:hypothetical protein